MTMKWRFEVMKCRVEVGRSRECDGKVLEVSVDVAEREERGGLWEAGSSGNALVTTPIALPRDFEMHFINFNCMQFFIITSRMGNSEKERPHVVCAFSLNECIPRCSPSLLPHTRPKRDIPRRVCLQH